MMREVMEKHAGAKNTELAEHFAEAMKKKGIKEDRDPAKIAQAFANEKAQAKRRNDAGKGKGRRGGGRQAVEAGNGVSRGGFTLLDLEAVEALSKRVGGYEPLMQLLEFMANRR